MAQKVCRPAQQLVEVHSGTAEDGIEPVTFNALEAVAVHPVLFFQVSDSRFNGCPAFHPAPQTPGSSPTAAFVDMNLNLARVSMAPVAHVYKCMLRAAGNPLDLIQGIFQSMAVIRVVMHGHGADKPATATGGCHADLAAKFVALVGLALADALHMRFMDAVNFVFIVSLLREDSGCGIQQQLQLGIRFRLSAFDVSDDSAQIRSQFAGAPSSSFHLLGMCVSALAVQQVL